MPLLEVQKRFAEILRIRLGDKSEKGAPRKLDAFRLTSASLPLLESAAQFYGGTAREWKGSPHEGTQYELYTEVGEVPVVVPPGDHFSQWAEMWSAGGCIRRCDQQTETLSDQPCMCPSDPKERQAAAQQGRACKLTTRFSVFLADLPEVGLARCESHGYYAASELGALYDVIERANTEHRFINAWLRIDHRTSKRDGKTHRFIVPVLELRTGIPALVARLSTELAAPPEHRALESAPQALPPAPDALPPSPPKAPRRQTRKAAEATSPQASASAPSTVREAVEVIGTQERGGGDSLVETPSGSGGVAGSEPATSGAAASLVWAGKVHPGKPLAALHDRFLHTVIAQAPDEVFTEADAAVARGELARRAGE